MKIKWILTGLLALVVAVVVAGVAILSTMEFEELRGVIEAEAEKATGRKLTIAGAIDLEISLTPAIEIQEVSFANAEWGSKPALLTVQEFELEVALLPLLSGDIQVRRLVIIKPDILLETDAEGRGNWEMALASEDTAAPAESTGKVKLPDVGTALVEDALVTYRDGKTGEVVQAKFSKMELRRTTAPLPLELSLEGAYNDVAFKAEGAAGLIRDMIGTEPYPVRLSLAVGGATLEVDGSIAEPVTGQGVNLNVQARGENLADLGAAAGIDLPAIGPYDVSTQIDQEGQTYKLTALTAKIGDSDIAGNATIALGGERPALDGNFSSDSLNLADLAPAGDTEAAPAAPAAAEGQRYVFRDDPLPLEGLKTADAKVKLNAKRLVLRNRFPFTDLEVGLSLQGGNLTVDPFAGGFAGGTLNGSVSLGAGKSGTPVAVKLIASGIDYGGLLKELEVTEGVAGSLDAKIDLRGAGASPRAIAAGLGGRIEVTGDEGTLSHSLVQTAGAGVSQMLTGWAGGSSDLRLNCIVVRMPVKDGVATSEAILLDTKAATVGGTGTIDLSDETLGLKVTPQAKQTSLMSLVVPFLIQGTLAKPNVIPDPVGTAVGAAKIAGMFINPLAAGAALVLPAAVPGKNPCVEALEGSAKASGDGAAQAQPEKSAVESTTEGLGGAVEGVGEGISKGLKSLFGN